MTCQQRMNPAVVVPLTAEIDLTNNEQVYDLLYAAFFSGAAVVIADFTATWFCDCASLRRLLTVQRRAAAQGGQLRLMIPPGSPVRRVADLLGLDGRLHIYASTREASASLPGPPVRGPAAEIPAERVLPLRRTKNSGPNGRVRAGPSWRRAHRRSTGLRRLRRVRRRPCSRGR